MQDILERFATHALQRLRRFTTGRDRLVSIGVILAFVPIFPACAFGCALCAANLLRIWMGRLPRHDFGLVGKAFLAGALATIVWLYLFAQINNVVAAALNVLLALALSILGEALPHLHELPERPLHGFDI
jgi:hypothetical protein